MDRQSFLAHLNNTARQSVHYNDELSITHENGKHIIKINLDDGAALIEVTWFNNPFVIPYDERCIIAPERSE